jgi:hypothetical protein
LVGLFAWAAIGIASGGGETLPFSPAQAARASIPVWAQAGTYSRKDGLLATNRGKRKRKNRYNTYVAAKDKKIGEKIPTLPAPPPTPVTVRNEMMVRLQVKTNDPNRADAYVPAAGIEMVVTIYNRDRKKIDERRVTVGTARPGELEVPLTVLPCVVEVEPVDSEEWLVEDVGASIVAVTGHEGRLALGSIDTGSGRAQTMVRWQTGRQKPKPKPKSPPKKPATNTGQKGRKPTAPVVRVVKRLYEPTDPILLTRRKTTIQFQGSPNTVITLGDQTLKTDGEGNAKAVVDVEIFDEGGVRASASQEGALGTRNADILVPKGLPGSTIDVKVPDLKLANVMKLEVARLEGEDLSLLTDTDLERRFGKPRKAKADKDASEWWSYEKDGLAFKMRKVRIERRDKFVAERIRLTKPQSGAIGDIRVGTSGQAVNEAFGPAESAPGGADLGFLTYLDGAIAFHTKGSAIDMIEIRRPIGYIKQGIDLTPLPRRLRVYVMTPTDQTEKISAFAETVESLITQVPGMEVVKDPIDADYRIDIQVDDFTERKEKFLGTVPSEYACDLRASITVADSDGRVARSEDGEEIGRFTARGSGGASYEKDLQKGALAALGGGVLAELLIKDKETKRIAQAAIAAATAAAATKMPSILNRAAERSREIAIRTVVSEVLTKLRRIAPQSIRISEIDYGQGIVTLAAGRDHGIRAGDEFELLNGSEPIGDSKATGLREERLVAVADFVEAGITRCKIVKITRFVTDKAEEKVELKDDRNAAKRLCEPSTALPVAARMLRISE